MEKEVTKEPKTVSLPTEPAAPEGVNGTVNRTPSGVRYASDEQFRKAQAKTSTLHAGLFRRLAK